MSTSPSIKRTSNTIDVRLLTEDLPSNEEILNFLSNINNVEESDATVDNEVGDNEVGAPDIDPANDTEISAVRNDAKESLRCTNDTQANQKPIELDADFHESADDIPNEVVRAPRKDQWKVGNVTSTEFDSHRKNVNRAAKEKQMDVKAAKLRLITLLCMDTEAVVMSEGKKPGDAKMKRENKASKSHKALRANIALQANKVPQTNKVPQGYNAPQTNEAQQAYP
ncbi:hypothetical protein Bhyg_07943 [Pseudolycoriella hygida]|uniref:Uncharacterized protein n=1 Tax=Pseudolycoriella hygida TaxID=35572 RepID=A0A9Q0S2H1_9DIPT|nr:hypothetical protein Bhyg_07943 [Pseudolycoriella hygida]